MRKEGLRGVSIKAKGCVEAAATEGSSYFCDEIGHLAELPARTKTPFKSHAFAELVDFAAKIARDEL